MSEERSGWAPREEWWPPEHYHHHHHQQIFGYKMPPSSSTYQHPPPPQWWHYSDPQALPDVHVPAPRAPPRPAVKMPKVSKSGSETKPRGRMTAYAFFVQICREEHKKKHPEENVVFSEFSKKCAERWKTMSEKEKKRFHEMADKDKKRYETEMKSYIPPESDKKRGKKRKQTKDPNAPKRSLSAFFWFCSDERGKVKEANPEFGVGEIAKELGRRWTHADPSIKSKYEEMADKDKARYDREMTEYKKKGKVTLNTPAPPKKEGSEDDVMDDDDEEEEDE